MSHDVYSRITDHDRCFVIAEIGSNHDGDFGLACHLIDVAASSGADAVKFQSFLADQLVLPTDPNYELLKRLELKRDWYPRLKAEADARGLVFFSTATNDVTLGWLEDIDVALYKIASPNLTHIPLIRKTASLGKPVIMSTGMAGLREIDEAVAVFRQTGNEMLALLHCVSEYPARPEAVNLRFMTTLAEIYPQPVGFSDHTLDIGTAIAAVALGARIVEKHLTLSRTRPGPDHHYSLEPPEFEMLVRNIRVAEQALGKQGLIRSAEERTKAESYWRSLHVKRDMTAGSVIAAEDLAVVRPNDGLHSRYFDAVVGMRLICDLTKGAPLTWGCFKDPS